MPHLRIRLVKSIAGRIRHQKTAVRRLGLIHNGMSVNIEDTPETRALIAKASPLLSVQEISRVETRSRPGKREREPGRNEFIWEQDNWTSPLTDAAQGGFDERLYKRRAGRPPYLAQSQRS